MMIECDGWAGADCTDKVAGNIILIICVGLSLFGSVCVWRPVSLKMYACVVEFVVVYLSLSVVLFACIKHGGIINVGLSVF